MTPKPKLRLALVIVGWLFSIFAVYCVYSGKAEWLGIAAIAVGVGLAGAAWLIGVWLEVASLHRYSKEDTDRG